MKSTAASAAIYIDYSPYGVSSVISASIAAFKGEHLDATAGGYALGNGYRLYNPALMRFGSPDSESPFGIGGINTYAFIQNDPVNGLDPTGHFNWTKALSKLGRAYEGEGKVLDGIRVFRSQAAGRQEPSVLHILSHGQPGLLLGKELGYTPKRLKVLLEENGVQLKGQTTHFLSCYSAASPPQGGLSFIQEWSNITGAQTTGYTKGVPTIRSKDGEHHHAVVLPVLPGYKQVLRLSSKPVTVVPQEQISKIRE